MNTIIAIGAVQALFFSLLLYRKQNGTICDKVLAMWLFLLFVQIIINYLQFIGYHDQYPHFKGSTSSFIFLYGPLLYFYVDNYMSQTPGFKKKYYWHLLPFLLYNLILLPFYLKSGENKLLYFQQVIKNDPPLIFDILVAGRLVTIPIYLVWILAILRKHQKNIRNYFSFTETVDLNWIKFMVYSISILAIFIYGIIVFNTYYGTTIETEKYIFSIASIWIFGLGYYGMRQTLIFSNVKIHEPESGDLSKTSQDFKKNILKALELENFGQTLTAYMEREKPYLKSRLTIDDLALSLNIPSHHLSMFLNDSVKQNFLDFINSYRIKELMEKLKDPKYKNITILGMAFECGFNSKASMNRIFKNQTGQTPSKYLRSTKSA